MKIVLLFLLSLPISMNLIGQEPGHNFKLVFVDSLDNIITPDIWVNSKQINTHTMKVDESKIHYLKADSVPKFQIGPIRIDNQAYIISPIAGSHWLDREYNIELHFNGQIMKLNFIANEGSFQDTIEFRNGYFVYFHKDLTFGIISKQPKSKLIELESNILSEYCALNCDGTVINLDSTMKTLILKSNKYFPEFLIVNNVPIGVLHWNEYEDRLSLCYFSEEYIKLLKKNY